MMNPLMNIYENVNECGVEEQPQDRHEIERDNEAVCGERGQQRQQMPAEPICSKTCLYSPRLQLENRRRSTFGLAASRIQRPPIKGYHSEFSFAPQPGQGDLKQRLQKYSAIPSAEVVAEVSTTVNRRARQIRLPHRFRNDLKFLFQMNVTFV
ncbi:hypothetical protein BDW59DRAFT_155372 [Aspergillus cavernicola]|uniref:Uncharacterized protein n=1 Tax=Aspergillus cavernicola TaxID=176166 RepID=A0ABR4HBH5_9EURO